MFCENLEVTTRLRDKTPRNDKFYLFFSFFLFQWCDPSISTSTWSNREGVACNDGDQCTRGDTCQSGRCSTTPFTCNSLCQYCNGSGCSLKTGFGFTNGCTCKIGGMSAKSNLIL